MRIKNQTAASDSLAVVKEIKEISSRILSKANNIPSHVSKDKIFELEEVLPKGAIIESVYLPGSREIPWKDFKLRQEVEKPIRKDKKMNNTDAFDSALNKMKSLSDVSKKRTLVEMFRYQGIEVGVADDGTHWVLGKDQQGNKKWAKMEPVNIPDIPQD